MRVLDSHVHWFDLTEYGDTWYKGWPSKTDKGWSRTVETHSFMS